MPLWLRAMHMRACERACAHHGVLLWHILIPGYVGRVAQAARDDAARELLATEATYAEIADAMAVTEHTVMVRAHRLGMGRGSDWRRGRVSPQRRWAPVAGA